MTAHPAPAPPQMHPEEEEGDHRVSGTAKLFLGVVAIGLVLVAAVVVTISYVHRVHGVRDARSKLEAERDKGERISVTQVQMTKANRVVTLPGDVRGFNQTTLYAKVSGYVRDVRVERGQHVKAGDVLATIESPENERDVIQAEQDYALARINSQRYQTLAPSGVVSNQERDTAVTQAKVSHSILSRAQDILAYTVVRAPFDGIVSARYVDPGALLPAATGATQSAQPLVDIADTSVIRIFAYVGQDTAAFIHVGDDVTVWQDEIPAQQIPAEITYSSGALDPRTRAMQVEVDLPNTEWNILPGTFTHVDIQVQEPPSPIVPDDAIVVRDGKTAVALIQGGKAHYVDVDLGYNDGAQVRVLRGLKGGETIGTNVPVEVQEGAPVQVAPTQEQTGEAPASSASPANSAPKTASAVPAASGH